MNIDCRSVVSRSICVFICLYLCGCGYKKSHTKEIEAAQKGLLNVSCQEVAHEMKVATDLLNNIQDSCRTSSPQPHNLITCTTNTKSDIALNRYRLSGHVSYLRDVYQSKRCE